MYSYNPYFQRELEVIEQYEEFLCRSEVIRRIVVDEDNEYEHQLRMLLNQSWFAKPKE